GEGGRRRTPGRGGQGGRWRPRRAPAEWDTPAPRVPCAANSARSGTSAHDPLGGGDAPGASARGSLTGHCLLPTRFRRLPEGGTGLRTSGRAQDTTSRSPCGAVASWVLPGRRQGDSPGRGSWGHGVARSAPMLREAGGVYMIRAEWWESAVETQNSSVKMLSVDIRHEPQAAGEL